MRHKFAYRRLNRTSEHRKALFKNMLNSLIKYEQITTTLPKAKELKPKIDKAITLGKKNNLQSKKNLFSKLQDKSSVDKLIKTLSQRYDKRKGGLFTIDEVKQLWASRLWSGKKSGNPLVVRGGYNCRHQWSYVNPDWYNKKGELII